MVIINLLVFCCIVGLFLEMLKGTEGFSDWYRSEDKMTNFLISALTTEQYCYSFHFELNVDNIFK